MTAPRYLWAMRRRVVGGTELLEAVGFDASTSRAAGEVKRAEYIARCARGGTDPAEFSEGSEPATRAEAVDTARAMQEATGDRAHLVVRVWQKVGI